MQRLPGGIGEERYWSVPYKRFIQYTHSVRYIQSIQFIHTYGIYDPYRIYRICTTNRIHCICYAELYIYSHLELQRGEETGCVMLVASEQFCTEILAY